jgi:hypothetical protein
VRAQFTFTTNNGAITITGYTGSGGAVIIPTNINGFAVTSIGNSAFQTSSITSVTIPDSVTSIGSGAFYDCYRLSSVTIPNGVTNLGVEAFYYCENLTGISIPSSLTSIGNEVFYDCYSLSSATIPGSITNIGNEAFYFCEDLPSVTIPGSVSGIGESAFVGCSSLTNVTMDSGVVSIGDEAFSGCPVTSIMIPDSVLSIGASAFSACSSLTNVIIGGGVTNIGSSAFGFCLNLTNVCFEGNPPTNSGASGGHLFGGDPVTLIFYLSGARGWGLTFDGIPTAPCAQCGGGAAGGALKLTIYPAAAASAGAQWQVDDGTWENSGVIINNLSVGNHTVSFTNISGWITPINQTITISNGATTAATGLYIPSTVPSDGLVLLANGPGTIQHESWPNKLVIGQSYTVTAVPKAKYLFAGWLGGTAQPYSILSMSPIYTFTMEQNLVLAANFVPTVFLAAQGTYYGLFVPTNSAREQGNSGSFNFTLTGAGVVSGKLHLGSEFVPLSGKFEADGSARISSARGGEASLITTLQLDFEEQTVTGTVSDGSFIAELSGFQNFFSSTNPATPYQGQYTLIIPGTTNPAIGPYGTSYGTLTVRPSGKIAFAGSLADGTPVSQSSVVSQGGLWPLYVTLPGGKGSLWSWNYFTNSALTNASALSWINETNPARTARYRSGFTNDDAAVSGGLLPAGEGFGGEFAAILRGGGLPFAITNIVSVSASGAITPTNSVVETNKLKLQFSGKTGVITGSFANPAEPSQKIKVSGVVLPGATNAQGYFLGTDQGGAFLLTNP